MTFAVGLPRLYILAQEAALREVPGGPHQHGWGSVVSAQLSDICWLAFGLKSGSVLQHALCGVFTAVEKHVLNEAEQLLVKLAVLISNDL